MEIVIDQSIGSGNKLRFRNLPHHAGTIVIDVINRDKTEEKGVVVLPVEQTLRVMEAFNNEFTAARKKAK